LASLLKPMYQEDQWRHGKSLKISQKELLKKFRSYFEVQKRDLAFMNQYQGGICNGLSFLYTLQENDDRFFSQLDALVSWNGHESSLDSGMEDLFEAKITETHWFQESIAHSDEDEQSLEWLHKQLAILRPDLRLDATSDSGLIQCSVHKLTAIFECFQEIDNINLFVGGSGHAIAIKIRNGIFHYYDCNLPWRTAPQASAHDAAHMVACTKYRMRQLSIEPMLLRMFSYVVSPQA
jgi:hypothetical protein